uniref:tetratricopeptide repeat protein n=1 Tax=Allorhizocola rhizosphaerae TaxID=1872709 RepID=UPI0013C36FC2
LVLDDAAGAAQVLPLLPGTPGCAVLITSRATLSGLAALAGVRTHTPGVLDPADAHALVASLLGPDRARAEPAAVAELIALCGGLPLALRIAMVNLTARPHATVAEYADELRGRDRLARLAAVGEPTVGVRSAFDLSYASLAEAERRAFRLLGVYPAMDFGAASVAALYGVDGSQARSRLAALTAASLITEHTAGRFQLHDLIRLYAVDRLESDEPQESRRLARQRLLDWYLQTALAAGAVLGFGTGGEAGQAFDTQEEAMRWFDAERDNLVALIRAAAADGLAPMALRLFEAIQPDLRNRNHVDAWGTAVDAALEAASGDPAMSARLRLSRGTLWLNVGRFDDACREMSAALPDAALAGDETEMRMLHNLALTHLELGQLAEASERLSQAHAIALRNPETAPANLARILGGLGIVSLERGELLQARDQFAGAAAAARQAGLPFSEKMAVDNLGEVHRELGELETAGAHFAAAAALSRTLGARLYEAASMIGVAEVHTDSGRHTEARRIAEESLRTLREMNQPRIEVDALNVLGHVARRLGETALAIDYYTQARDLAHTIRYRRAEILALAGLTQAGESPEHARRALAMAREAGLVLLENRVRAVLSPPGSE